MSSHLQKKVTPQPQILPQTPFRHEHSFLMETLILLFDTRILAQVSIHQVLQERYMRGIVYEVPGKPLTLLLRIWILSLRRARRECFRYLVFHLESTGSIFLLQILCETQKQRVLPTLSTK